MIMHQEQNNQALHSTLPIDLFFTYYPILAHQDFCLYEALDYCDS